MSDEKIEDFIENFLLKDQTERSNSINELYFDSEMDYYNSLQ